MLIPLLVVGYGALMIMSLPIAGYQDFIAHIWSGHVMDMLQFIYHGVNDIFAVLLAVTTSVSYALIKSRKKSGFVEPGMRLYWRLLRLPVLPDVQESNMGVFR